MQVSFSIISTLLLVNYSINNKIKDINRVNEIFIQLSKLKNRRNVEILKSSNTFFLLDKTRTIINIL